MCSKCFLYSLNFSNFPFLLSILQPGYCFSEFPLSFLPLQLWLLRSWTVLLYSWFHYYRLFFLLRLIWNAEQLREKIGKQRKSSICSTILYSHFNVHNCLSQPRLKFSELWVSSLGCRKSNDSDVIWYLPNLNWIRSDGRVRF